LLQGSRRASNESELRQELRKEGVLLLAAKPDRKASAAETFRGVSAKELTLFTFHLQNVLDSGIPILSGLRDLAAEIKDARFRGVVDEVIDSLTNGETLAQALGHHPRAFNALYVNMIEAGEQTGNLPHVLERIVQLLELQQEFRRRIRDLTTYPLIVLFALCGLVAIVVGFVFPRFSEIFDRVHFQLPVTTRILMAISTFLTSYWLLILIGAAVAWAGFFALYRVPRVRLFVDTWLLKAPVFGPLVAMINFGQVARSLASFLDSGIPLPKSLEMIAKMVSNLRVSTSISAAKEAILGGETLSDALRSEGVFPPLVLRMVSMGEQSGRLVAALEKAGTIYDREIPVHTKRVFDVLNPLLTAIMGGILLFVIISVMTPLYRMYQEIGTSY
jgi:type IV pilus assembly protein PilC